MLDLIAVILFGWLFLKTAGIALQIAWGVAKVVAVVLMVLALPALICCLLFAGGIVLFAPLLLLIGAFAALKCL